MYVHVGDGEDLQMSSIESPSDREPEVDFGGGTQAWPGCGSMSGSSESCWFACTVISLEVKHCGPDEVPIDLAEDDDSLVEVIQKITNALTRTGRTE